MHNSQEVANLIKSLAKSRKVAVGKMLSECNLSVNTLSSMQSGGYYPRLEAIAKIADYLGCSVDYLLGRTDDPESHIDKLSFLDERDRELVASIIEKSYERSRSDVNNVSVHELPRFKAVAHGGDILVNEPLEKPKIPD